MAGQQLIERFSLKILSWLLSGYFFSLMFVRFSWMPQAARYPYFATTEFSSPTFVVISFRREAPSAIALMIALYRWTATTVGYILDRQEYLGHTVLGKSICEKFKTKQRRAATADELIIFPNTHEAIVDQDTRNIAHKLRLRKRPKAANGT